MNPTTELKQAIDTVPQIRKARKPRTAVPPSKIKKVTKTVEEFNELARALTRFGTSVSKLAAAAALAVGAMGAVGHEVKARMLTLEDRAGASAMVASQPPVATTTINAGLPSGEGHDPVALQVQIQTGADGKTTVSVMRAPDPATSRTETAVNEPTIPALRAPGHPRKTLG